MKRTRTQRRDFVAHLAVLDYDSPSYYCRAADVVDRILEELENGSGEDCHAYYLKRGFTVCEHKRETMLNRIEARRQARLIEDGGTREKRCELPRSMILDPNEIKPVQIAERLNQLIRISSARATYDLHLHRPGTHRRLLL
jgi:hypothetical protein